MDGMMSVTATTKATTTAAAVAAITMHSTISTPAITISM
jgi:hypothetical protein